MRLSNLSPSTPMFSILVLYSIAIIILPLSIPAVHPRPLHDADCCYRAVRHLLPPQHRFLPRSRGLGHLFPHLPHHATAHPLAAGAFEQLRATWPGRSRPISPQIDTTALPVKHTSPSAPRLLDPHGCMPVRRDAAHSDVLLSPGLIRLAPDRPRLASSRRRQRAPLASDLLTGLPPRDLIPDRFSGAFAAARQPAAPPCSPRPPGQRHRVLPVLRIIAHAPGRDHLQRDHRPDGTSPPSNSA